MEARAPLNTHWSLRGLLRSLISFDTHAFVPQRQSCIGIRLHLLAFPLVLALQYHDSVIPLPPT